MTHPLLGWVSSCLASGLDHFLEMVRLNREARLVASPQDGHFLMPFGHPSADVRTLGVRIQRSYISIFLFEKNGGEGGIRTPVTLARKADFESAAFNRSATSPG